MKPYSIIVQKILDGIIFNKSTHGIGNYIIFYFIIM